MEFLQKSTFPCKLLIVWKIYIELTQNIECFWNKISWWVLFRNIPLICNFSKNYKHQFGCGVFTVCLLLLGIRNKLGINKRFQSFLFKPSTEFLRYLWMSWKFFILFWGDLVFIRGILCDTYVLHTCVCSLWYEYFQCVTSFAFELLTS